MGPSRVGTGNPLPFARVSTNGFPTVMVALGAAVFLGALDQTVVVTALPAIVDDLQVPFTRLNDAAWIVTAYLLGYTVAMPLVGRLSDVYGRKNAVLGCLVLLGATSVWCGAAQTLESLIAARGLQAVAGGALLPVTLAVVGTSVSEGRRSIVLGAVAATAEAGGVLGPLWGAFILDHASWRWIFWLSVPIVLALSVLVVRAVLPQSRGRGAMTVDWLGAALLGSGLGALALGLSRETSQGLPTRLGLILAAVVLLVAFGAWERRVRRPLVDLALFRARPFAAANALSLISGVALIVAMVDVPLWSAIVLHRSPVDGGLLLMRLMAAIPIGALLGGYVARRLGVAPTATLGVVAAGAGMALLGFWRPDTSDEIMTRDLAIAGLGFGLQLAPLTSVVVAWAGPLQAGVVSALATVMRMIGMLIGLSSLTGWGLDRFNRLVAGLALPLPVLGESAEVSQQRVDAYQRAVLDASLTVFGEIFLAAAAVCVLALLPALLLRSRSSSA